MSHVAEDALFFPRFVDFDAKAEAHRGHEELAKLLAGDADLEAGLVRVCRSRHLYEDAAPKTASAVRTVELVPETIRLLRAIQPLRVAPETPVFINTEGRPIEYRKLLYHFHACLRVLGIRVRGPYAMKDTYITQAFTLGLDPLWIEAQTGVRYETLKRHYGKYLRAERPDQVRRLVGLAPSLAPSAEPDRQLPEVPEEREWRRGESNPTDHAK